MNVDFWLCRFVLQIMFCICKCVCNQLGLDKFFYMDLIGVEFRWNGLRWCYPNFYSFIFLATKQRLKKKKFLFFIFFFFQYVNLRNDFAWVWRMGALEFMIFLWCFYAEFYRFMNLVVGFMNLICWRFRCWLKDEKIWVWVVILYI